MEAEPARKNIALALLAVLTGAVVQVASTEQPFSPWHTIVGLIMVASAEAYGSQISKGLKWEAAAFAMILAAGIVFSLGFVLDQAFAKIGLSWGDPLSGKPNPGFLSQHLEDDVYFTIWAVLSILILLVRRARNSPH